MTIKVSKQPTFIKSTTGTVWINFNNHTILDGVDVEGARSIDHIKLIPGGARWSNFIGEDLPMQPDPMSWTVYVDEGSEAATMAIWEAWKLYRGKWCDVFLEDAQGNEGSATGWLERVEIMRSRPGWRVIYFLFRPNEEPS